MEQKQLDELDETFFGEEFVDDESDSVTIKSAKEGSKTMSAKKNAPNSKKKPVPVAKTPAKKTKITPTLGKQSSKEKSLKSESAKEPSFKDEIKVEVVKTPLEKVGPVEISSPVNPWAEEKYAPDSSSFFTQASTWKAITGLVIILLLVSVFTQGFRFSASPSSGQELSLEEAEAKVLEYVNTKLLQPPYVAQVESSREVGNLYLVRLSVASQSIDSYITKDGSLFFPQGFNTSKSLEEQTPTTKRASKPAVGESASTAKTNQSSSAAPPSTIDKVNVSTVSAPDTRSNNNISNNSASVAGPASVAAPVGTSTGQAAEIKMTSRKWLFFPQKVTVKAGSLVKLSITPDNSNPTFALPTYTFSIPQLSVKKDIFGPTTIEFTPKAAGSYPFSCSSCEDWRGMNGVLIVQ